MNSRQLIQKMLIENRRQVKFLEEYYSDLLKEKVEISIQDTPTSYYSQYQNLIVISTENLLQVLEADRKLVRPMFYTLLLHEIGHAIYTYTLPYTEMSNILEDNRIEHQISKWNSRAQFKLLRYIFQDKVLTADKLTNYTNVALALLRTINNAPTIKELGTTGERMMVIKEILELNEKYKSIDTQYGILQDVDADYSPLTYIIDKVHNLVLKLIQLPKEEPNQDQDSDKDPQEQKSDSQDQEQDTDQDNAQEDDSDDTEQQATVADIEKQIEDLESQLSDLEDKALKQSADKDYDRPVLFNPHPDISDYHKYNVSAFSTKRNAGIKGSRDVARMSGTAKQLSLKKYMRRGVVPREKMFDKPMANVAKGGKAATVSFYLDISGSMGGERLRIATDYLKSFYDTMNKHMNINLYAFGVHTYKITRNELNRVFLERNLEGSTRLKPAETHNNEEIIVITDGEIKNEIPEQFKRKAHFVLIDLHDSIYDYLYKDIPHTYRVEYDNIAQGLDQATKGLRRLLS